MNIMMNKTMRLFLVMVCFSMNAQASSPLTTLAQCLAPVVSGYAAYQTKQDMDKHEKLLVRLNDRQEVVKQAVVKKIIHHPKKERIDFCAMNSYFYAVMSVVFVATSINQDHIDKQFVAIIFAASLSGMSLGNYMYNHNRMVHIESMAQAAPSMMNLQGHACLEKRKKSITSDKFRQK